MIDDTQVMTNANTPKYAADISGFGTRIGFGNKKPTTADLEAHAMALTVSTMPGFINEKLFNGDIKMPNKITVRYNCIGGEVVAEWLAPMFTTLPDPADYPNVAKAHR